MMTWPALPKPKPRKQMLWAKRASAAPEPPNYRKADSKERCGVCKMFDKGLCWGYGNTPVEKDHVCDSFAPDDQHRESRWPTSWSIKESGIPVRYHPAVDPGGDYLRGWAGRWPAIWDREDQTLHIGPEGATHDQVRGDMGVAGEDGFAPMHHYDGWIGHNPEASIDESIDPQTGTPFGFYGNPPASRVPPEVPERMLEYHRTYLRPSIDPNQQGGYGHGLNMVGQWSSKMASPLVEPLEPHLTLYHGTTNRALDLARQRGGLHAWHPHDVATEVANHYGLNPDELYHHPYFEFSRSARDENNVYTHTDPRVAQSYADARSEQLTDALRTAHRMTYPDYESPVNSPEGLERKADLERFVQNYFEQNAVHPQVLKLTVPQSAIPRDQQKTIGWPDSTYTLPSPVPLDWISSEQRTASSVDGNPPHYNRWTGRICHCPWSDERVRMVRQAGQQYNKLLKANDKRLRTPEGQSFLETLGNTVGDQYDSLAPFLAQRWKKGDVHEEKGNVFPLWTHGTDPITPARLHRWHSWFEARQHPTRRGVNIMDPGFTPDHLDQHVVQFEGQLARDRELKELHSLGDTVHQFPNGWSVKNVTDPAALEAEGRSMGHCIGSDAQPYKEAAANGLIDVYSLRDPKGFPHATWHYNSDGSLAEKFGANDSTLKPEYQDMLDEWGAQHGKDVDEGVGMQEQAEAPEVELPAADDLNSYVDLHGLESNWPEYMPDDVNYGENTDIQWQDPAWGPIVDQYFAKEPWINRYNYRQRRNMTPDEMRREVFNTAVENTGQAHLTTLHNGIQNYPVTEPHEQAIKDQWNQWMQPYYHPWTGEFVPPTWQTGWGNTPIAEQYQQRLFEDQEPQWNPQTRRVEAPPRIPWQEIEPRQPVASWKFAYEPDDLYHVAPTSERARIQQHGLQPSRPAFNPRWYDPESAGAEEMKNWGHEGPPQWLRDQPEGVYAEDNPQRARAIWGNDPMLTDELEDQYPLWDVWKIPGNQLDERQIKRDQEGNAWIIPHPVQPKLYQGGPEEYGSWPQRSTSQAIGPVRRYDKVGRPYHGVERYEDYCTRHSNHNGDHDGKRGNDVHLPLRLATVDLPTPGTMPIPEGHVRLWHYTGADPEQIRQQGLRLDQAKGETYGEPNQIWASGRPPSFDNHNVVEFHVPRDDPRWDIGRYEPWINYGGGAGDPNFDFGQYLHDRNAHVTFRGDIRPEEVLAVHEPWHEHYRYMMQNYPTPESASPNEFDWALDPQKGGGPELSKAITEWKNTLWPSQTTSAQRIYGHIKVADKLHDFLMNPKSRPDLQTPEAQGFLQHLGKYYHNDKTDALMPWITREWKKGRIANDPTHGFGSSPVKRLEESPEEYAARIDRPHLTIPEPSFGPHHHVPLRPEDLNHWGDFMRSNHPLKREMGDIMQHKLPEFHQRIQAWDQDMADRAQQEALQGGKVVHATPDNWTIRQLQTPKELKAEGDAMGHCVGSYADEVANGDSMIYSLRDPQGIPHATTEITPEWSHHPDAIEQDEKGYLTYPRPHQGTVVQIQGKANQEPQPEYKAKLRHWFESFPEHERPQWEEDSYWGHITDPEDIRDSDLDPNAVDEYGLRPQPTPANYPSLLERTMHDESSAFGDGKDRQTAYSPVIGERIYQLARARGEVPQMASAMEPFSDRNQERFDHWREDANAEWFPPYPDEEEFQDPEAYQLALEQYEEAEREMASGHPAMQANAHLWGLLNPHYNQETGQYENEPPETFR